MAKANNPRLQAQITPELKEVTDKMLKHLEMTQAEFFEKYLPTLFLAIDKDKYLSLIEEAYENNELKELVDKLTLD